MIKYALSASFGNDSMATIQWAYEQGLENVTVAFCETGWADPDWPARVVFGEAFARKLGFETTRIVGMGMEALVRMKSGFPGNGQQFCTAWLKGFPFLEWIDEIDPDRETIVVIGKRRAESQARKDLPEWVDVSEFHGDRKIWHPLFAHTDEERDALLDRAGIIRLSHRSKECSPCVNSNRNDFRNLSQAQIDRVAALEKEIGQPMFRSERFNGAKGIEEVVKWAKYSPGQFKPGQEDLFEDNGCGSPFGCGL